MMVLAQVKHDDQIISLLDSKLAKLESMTDPQWLEVKQALQDRKEQLKGELNNDYQYQVMADENKRLLKQLLQKYQRGAYGSDSL